jgi:hypothetical protein
MSVDQQHDRVLHGRRADATYFVGRRQFEAAEVYAVSGAGVDRLRSTGRHGEPSLDWHGSSAARLELSHLLIARVAGRRPSHELETLFAVTVLGNLGDDGFILDAEEIRGWLAIATDEDDFATVESHRRSWTGRLRALFHGGQTSRTDV